jgi:hypothetical protein
MTDEERAVIRDIVADFVHKKGYVTEKMCDIKMDNQEEDMKRFEGRMDGLGKKAWAIIMLLIANLVGLVVTSWAQWGQ